MIRKSLKEKIDDKVYYCVSGCWIWTGHVSRNGRPVLSMRDNGKIKTKTAARITWVAYRGNIPDGLCVCHHCDNPMCVNPDHLFLGTHQDNMRDMIKKGRNSKLSRFTVGVRPYNTKLTEMFASIIREGHNLKYNMADMARYFKVAHSTVKDCASGRSWKNIG